MMLRKLLFSAILPAAVAVIGCGPTTTPGGSTSKATDVKGNSVTVDETVKINGPPGAPGVPGTGYTLKQGESKQMEFSLTRGKDLKEDVDLAVEGADKLKVEVPKSVLASGDGKFTVKVAVPDDAAVADHSFKLTAKAGKGAPATAEVKIKVEKK